MKTYLLNDEMQVIGRAGETGIAVAVDVEDWITEYPDGVGGVLCERPDGKYVPVISEVVQGKLVAALPNECTSRPGVYTYTVTWNEGSIERLSHVYKTIILSAVSGRGYHDCPCTPAWATQVFAAAEQVTSSLDASLQIMTEGCVRGDVEQTFSSAEKLRARTNIDAAYQEDVDDLGNYITTRVPGLPTEGGVIADGRYQLKATVSSGTPAYSWGTDLSDFETEHFPGKKFQAGTGSATGSYAAAVGTGTTASGASAWAEGYQTTASGTESHAEGYKTTASGDLSHAEGGNASATAKWSHAEGYYTVAGGQYSHAEGFRCQANGSMSHAEGANTRATHRAQHVFGSYNVEDPSTAAGTANGTYLEIVGNGSDSDNRSNARTLDWSGNEELAGDLTIKKGASGETTVGTAIADLQAHFPSTGKLKTGSNSVTANYGTAVGKSSKVTGEGGFAQGEMKTVTQGGRPVMLYTLAEGESSFASGSASVVYGDYAQAMGEGVTARHRAEHVFGQYNTNEASEATFDERGDFVEVVGNGTSFSDLSNARTLDWSGNESLAGSLTLGMGTEDEVTVTAAQLKALIALIT